MAKPLLETLAVHLPNAVTASLASSSTAARRAIASSLAPSSAAGYDVLEVYAELRVSTASAARRAVNHAVTCAASSASPGFPLQKPCASESAMLEAPRLPSTLPFVVALHAIDWVRAALGPNIGATAARGEADYFAYPSSTASSVLLLPTFVAPVLPTAAAARAAANLAALTTLIPASSSSRIGLVVPDESEATIAAVLPASSTAISFVLKGGRRRAPRSSSMWGLVDTATSMKPFRCFAPRSVASSAWHVFYSSSSNSESEEPISSPLSYPTVRDLMALMNRTELDIEEEILFRRAFNDRYQNFLIADVGDYLENKKWTFEELRYILKIVNRKAGPHKELMELLIKEDMLYGCSSEDEYNQNPVLARVESKVDTALKRLKEQGADIRRLSDLLHNQKTDWGSVKVFVRKLCSAIRRSSRWSRDGTPDVAKTAAVEPPH
ncbi:uncharacterized protein LOC133897648 [Phragmites australis]|uniref:uncharacterized protein LOC133897648 n=1 Tax=Phragmites australis TaxID=29695 RepID=UPI002D770640|nr:uncharacterized protein LOC133897648 [Phragmites australis]